MGQQVNYLIDEADLVGKGANTTISLVHHSLEMDSLKAEELLLHADNCVGQNKNNATVHYILWRVLTEQKRTIQLSFMLAGHTKFAPDPFFGLIKKVYQRTRVDTMQCLVQVVQSSTVTKETLPNQFEMLLGSSWSSFLSEMTI